MSKKQGAISTEQLAKKKCTPAHFSYRSNFLLFVLCSLFFVLIACKNPLSSPEKEVSLPANMGSFSLDIANNNTIAGNVTRTILPAAPALGDFAMYTLAFTATGGGAVNLNADRTNATLANPIVLAAGTYNLTVSAYKDAAKTQLMARGSATGIVITAGGNTASSVVLNTLLGEAGTSGTFSWNITLGTSGISVSAATMTIKDSGGTQQGAVETLNTTGQTSGNRTLTSGVYTITFEITDSTNHRSLVWNELLYVYSSLTGNFTKTFTDADFHRTHWNVTFDYDNGGIYEYGSLANLGEVVQSVENGGFVTAPAVDRPGYFFGGWFTDTACTNQWTLTTDPVHHDMFLYAKWTANTAGITLSIEDIIDGTPVENFGAIEISRGGGIVTRTLTVTGTYDSVEWRITKEGTSTTETIVNGDSIILDGTNSNYNRLGNHILTLTVTLADGMKYLLSIPFIVVDTYWNITFNENYTGSAVPATQSVLHGSIVPPTVPARSDYMFAGWNTAADGSGTAYLPGDSITVTADMILYAQWKIEVTIDMFDSNGDGWDGSGALEIYINGAKHSDARLASGATGSYIFTVEPGDMVEFYWKSGTYLTEDSFIVYYTDEPPSPAFTASNNNTWSGINALFYKLRGSLSTADIGQKIGEFEVDRGTGRPKITTQPVGKTYFFGINTTAVPLTIAAATADANLLSYQWYSNTVDSVTGGTLLAGAISTSYTPDISVEGTTYYYCVVTNTGTNDTRTSAVVSIIVGPGEVTIDMFDYYGSGSGDGWNGNSLEIRINGVRLSPDATITGSSAKSGTYTFAVLPNDLIEFYWHGTSYVIENSFIVYYTNEPPVPAFTQTTSTWSGDNALFYKLRGSLSTADNEQKIGEFEVAGGTPRPRITAQPVGKSYLFGVDTVAVPLTISAVSADVNPISYQWYSNTIDSAIGGILLAGATGTSYTPDISVEGTTYYYCVVTNTGTNDTRTSAVVSIVVRSGDGSAGAPWTISSAADLQLIGTDDASGWGLNDHYILTGDVMLIAPWTPIAGNFTGSFDGGGHTISGLEISGGTGHKGMFVTIGSGGVVKNLGLLDVDIQGSEDIGAIAGQVTGGTIENCYASGIIISSGSSTSGGGIVGYNATSSMVSNCFFNGTVECGNSGGIVGYNTGTVKNCYAAGIVTCTASNYASGITASGSGSKTDCVALGDLKVSGGGTAYRISSTTGSIANCYARDDLTITIGANAPITRTSTDANSADGADVTTTTPNGGYNAQAFWETTMGWDFTSIWEMGTVTILINGTPTPMALPVLRNP